MDPLDHGAFPVEWTPSEARDADAADDERVYTM